MHGRGVHTQSLRHANCHVSHDCNSLPHNFGVHAKAASDGPIFYEHVFVAQGHSSMACQPLVGDRFVFDNS